MRGNAAVRLHTLLDLRGNIPAFIRISTGKMHEVRVLDELPIERGAFYVMDKAYIDFARLYRMHRQAAFFVTRHKKDHAFARQESRPIEKATGVRSDQTIRLKASRPWTVTRETVCAEARKTRSQRAVSGVWAYRETASRLPGRSPRGSWVAHQPGRPLRKCR